MRKRPKAPMTHSHRVDVFARVPFVRHEIAAERVGRAGTGQRLLEHLTSTRHRLNVETLNGNLVAGLHLDVPPLRPSDDLTNRAKESARRTYEESLRTNAYWLGRFRTVHLFGQDPSLVVTRNERIDSVTLQILQDTFKKYFPPDRYTVVTLTPEAGAPAK
jgi:predicted Zn-dependent peptidase